MSHIKPYIPASNNIPDKKGGALILDNANNILMVQQKNGKWSLPKGSQKVGEDIFTTALRETLEETQFDIAPYEDSKVGEKEFIRKPNGESYTFYIYKLPIHHGDITYNDTVKLNSRSIKWISITDVIKTLGGKQIDKMSMEAIQYAKTRKNLQSGSGRQRRTKKTRKSFRKKRYTRRV